MKKVLYIILAIFAILILGYVIILNLPQASTKNKEASITIEASQLFDKYSNSEKQANTKYNGKVIEVSGVVRNVTKDKKGDIAVILNTNDMIGGILCTFENPPREDLKKGQSVKIKGQCNGLLMDVVLNKCNLVQ